MEGLDAFRFFFKINQPVIIYCRAPQTRIVSCSEKLKLKNDELTPKEGGQINTGRCFDAIVLFPPCGMLRRSRCVQIFFQNTESCQNSEHPKSEEVFEEVCFASFGHFEGKKVFLEHGLIRPSLCTVAVSPPRKSLELSGWPMLDNQVLIILKNDSCVTTCPL